MKVFVTGGTGLVGRRLVKALLARGDEVVILSRSATKARAQLGEQVQVVEGDPSRSGVWQAAVEGCDGVVNLVGEPVLDNAWTPEQKQKLRNSRIVSTQNVAEAIVKAKHPPRVLVSASAVGFYGNRPEEQLDETSAMGPGFICELCRDWEEAAGPVQQVGVRLVSLRIGIVLDKSGGALQGMAIPFRLFAGGPVGDPRQWIPWIHQLDLTRLLLFALDTPGLSGPVNATAPEPVQSAGFARALGKALGRPSWLPVPATAVKLALGERAEVALASQRVLPRRALQAGFQFSFPELGTALLNIYSGHSGS